jgi:hypothetical protein
MTARAPHGWRAILKAAFALPMTRAECEFFSSVAEREPPSRPVRELWVIAGRRSGKDSIASLIAAYTASLFDGHDRLRPGERPLVLCLACDREQSQIVLGYVRSYFADVPMLAKLVRRETANGLELTTGVDIAVGTSDYRAVRGRTLLCTIFDELAFWRQDGSASPDREVYRAIRPGMATLPGSMLIGITSAYRRSGLAYDRWQRHYGKNDPKVLVIRAESRALNPTLDQAEVDAALADDPGAPARRSPEHGAARSQPQDSRPIRRSRRPTNAPRKIRCRHQAQQPVGQAGAHPATSDPRRQGPLPVPQSAGGRGGPRQCARPGRPA